MPVIDLIGQIFGRLTVVGKAEKRQGTQFWNCLCECGTTRTIRTHSLVTGHTRSCGCLNRECAAKRIYAQRFTHGMGNTPEHASWSGMIQRCTNPNCHKYRIYGARGIVVDPRWREFTVFYRDMGSKPSPDHSIERIDNDGPYSPENCRWATPKEQAINTRNNRIVEFNGQQMTLVEAIRQSGINPLTVEARLYKQRWTLERALMTPAHPRRKAR